MNMSSSGQIFALEELSTMDVEPSELNNTCSRDSTCEDSMWHIISFEIAHKIQGLFFGMAFGGILSCLPSGFT